MQFLSIVSAWFGLALPIIALFYILKRKYDDTPISSHLLWRRATLEQEANRPWQRLRSRWLLLWQLLAALLIVLALMKPVMMQGNKEDELAVLLLDRSSSMTVIPELSSTASSSERLSADANNETRFEAAVQSAVSWIDDQPEHRPISLVVTGDEPLVLASGERDHALLKQKLEALLPDYGPSNQAAALTLTDSLHQGSSGGETVLFSDGLWQDAPAANEQTLLNPLQVVTEGMDSFYHNAGIISFGLSEEREQPGHNQAIVTIKNDSDREQNYTIAIYAAHGEANREIVAEVPITVPPGEWGSTDALDLPNADYYKTELRAYDDHYLIDNVAYQFPAVEEAKRVLLVTQGNLFLAKALQLAGVQIIQRSPESPAPTDEEDIDWVVLDGVSELLDAQGEWHAWLSHKPLLQIDHPGSSEQPGVVPKDHTISIAEHPVTEYLTLEDTHISRFTALSSEDTSWGSPIVTYGQIPAIYAGESNGQPRLRFTFKLQDSDLPLRPEFPVLMVQATKWLSGEGQSELGTVIAGESMSVPTDIETDHAEWRVVESAGAGLSQERELLEKPIVVNVLDPADIQAPSIPGLYQFIEKDDSNRVIASRYLAVRADPSELVYPSAGTVPLKLKQAVSSNEKEASPDWKDNATSAKSLINGLAAALMLLLLLEWEVYRRGHAS